MKSILKFLVFFAVNFAVLLLVLKALDLRSGSHSSADLARVEFREFDEGKINFDLLREAEIDAEAETISYPPELLALDGQQVEIIGFMMPGFNPFEFRQFILVNFPTGCKSCPVGTLQEQVFVDVGAKGTPPEPYEGLMHIKGRLLLHQPVPKGIHPLLGQFMYVIDRAEAAPYE